MRTDVAVVGGGATGMMCALTAARRGRRVTVFEKNPRLGRKILISGGGRCNFTNLNAGAANFISANPHFAKSALARFSAHDFLAMVESHGIPYHEKTAGQLFCDRAASDILEMLEGECRKAGACLETNSGVTGVDRNSEGFLVRTGAGEIEAGAVVVATGGLAIPKLGANGIGYDIARQFGLKVQPCRPALTPLVFTTDGQQQWRGMEGVALDCHATAGGHTFEGRALFTHHGLSGPAVLQASSYWKPGKPFTLNLAPGVDVFECLRARRSAGDRAGLRTILTTWLPKRLADRWCDVWEFNGLLAATGDHELALLATTLACWMPPLAGVEGYEKAEVTAGGVDTRELSSRTMEARRAPGLYFIGEVVDVTGQLGGYNFQWAWSSGYAAGQAV